MKDFLSVFSENLGEQEILDELTVNLCQSASTWLARAFYAHPKPIIGIALVLARVRVFTPIFRHALD